MHTIVETTQDTYKEVLNEIGTLFNKASQTLHKARNEIKLLRYRDETFVVKSFRKPNPLRALFYTFFLPSKAKKSYVNALRIARFTPRPVGYVEVYPKILLQKSYFVAKHFPYDFTIREVLLDTKFPDRENVFRLFAHFTYALHNEGIFHKDYSPGNILIQKRHGTYIFKIVDINRMVFRSLSFKDRLRNFEKLWASDDDLRIIAAEYAKIANFDVQKSIQAALYYSQRNKKIKNFKKKLKGKPIDD